MFWCMYSPQNIVLNICPVHSGILAMIAVIIICIFITNIVIVVVIIIIVNSNMILL